MIQLQSGTRGGKTATLRRWLEELKDRTVEDSGPWMELAKAIHLASELQLRELIPGPVYLRPELAPGYEPPAPMSNREAARIRGGT